MEFNCTRCNKEYSVSKYNIKNRKTTFCQPCSSLVGLAKVNIKPIFYSLYTKLQRSAKRKNKDFDLSFEEFIEFTKINNCYYCDDIINWSKYKERYNLDRKNNDIGYNKDNLVVCCWFCNDLKSNKLNFEEFSQLAPILKKIIEERKKVNAD